MPNLTSTIPATALLDPANLDNPYPLYRQLRQAAPVWRVPDTDIFVISSYGLLDEACRRIEDFSSRMTSVLYRKRGGVPARLHRRGGIMQVLATADPPIHGRHKMAIAGHFSPKRVATIEQDIQTTADALIDRALRQKTIEFMDVVANPLPMMIVSKLIGFQKAPLDKLLQAAFDSTAIVGGNSNIAQLGWYSLRSFLINHWIGKQLQAAEKEDTNILGSIKQGIASGDMTVMEGRAFLHIFLSAGGESTTSLLGNAVRILADDSGLQQTLRAQPELLPTFIEEVLRLEAPFRYHLRSVARETELGGVALPEGGTVLLFWGAANRDPAAFENADQIDLNRPRRHTTFGRGIHTCIGAPLARLEALVVLRTLLHRTTHIALDKIQEPRWERSLQVRRYQQLHVRLDT